MLVKEALLRALIREEVERLDEAVRNNHGYTVYNTEDVQWTPDKRMIPKERNPFVGSSPAYNSWYNDGQQSVRWSKEISPPGGDPYKIRGSTDIYFNEGDYVIIPTIDASIPGRIVAIYHKDAAAMGIPGADRTDVVPLANITWSEFGGQGPSRDVGLAFLVKVGKRDPLGSASSAMSYYRSGRDEMEEKEARRAEREARRAERDAARGPLAAPPAEMTPPAAPRTIRRVGGVAAPPPAPRPMSMSGDEIRDMLGLKRREE